jgi:hypothetical protein
MAATIFPLIFALVALVALELLGRFHDGNGGVVIEDTGDR